MRYKLLANPNNNFSAIQQILVNRGIPLSEINHYLNTTDNDINSPTEFGIDKLNAAAATLIKTISQEQNALVVIDADCDGFTSSAILINYLYDLFPQWVESHLNWFMHSGKQHGLSDVITLDLTKYSLIICPDASSNDYEYHQKISEKGKSIIVLDHHDAAIISPHAIVINNQLSDYPNKELSGAGVTWQFCRYIDSLLNVNYANEYLDLVALGLMADMMSLKSIETKHLINKGFKNENVKNPFIYMMADKNNYSLGGKITPMGAAFYISPFVNAMVRSGNQEEKELLFLSMLNHKAFKRIPSTKRGHSPGETERLVDQAVRVSVNVKNRQTGVQDKGLEYLTKMIKEKNLLDHKVLLFLLEPGQVDRNIAGLIANKFMAKYQRPCCILTKVNDNGIISYQGSARGCDKVGITDFKKICADTGVTMFEEGHPGAFGLGILEKNIPDFIRLTDIALKDMPDEAVYLVDYIYRGVDIDPENILDIATLNDLWGKDMDESFVAIEHLKISSDMVTLMSPDRRPTLKINIPNKVALIKFGSNQQEYESFLSTGYIEINIIGKCNCNDYGGWITPQILIEDYEIIGSSRFNF